MILNTIRTRAELDPITTNIPEELLSAILHERQVELFTEGGIVELDLKELVK